MTSEQIIAALWEAYKAGIESLLSLPLEQEDLDGMQKQFNEWLSIHHPQLLESPKQYPRSYWHEFGCNAKSTTPSGVGLCNCNALMPDGTYDHDLDCPAIKTTRIGRDSCICLARRAGQYEHRIP